MIIRCSSVPRRCNLPLPARDAYWFGQSPCIIVGFVVVVLTITRHQQIESVVTGQAPVTPEWKHTPGNKQTKSGTPASRTLAQRDKVKSSGKSEYEHIETCGDLTRVVAAPSLPEAYNYSQCKKGIPITDQ